MKRNLRKITCNYEHVNNWTTIAPYFTHLFELSFKQ